MHLNRPAVLAALVLLAACGGESTVEITPSPQLDLAFQGEDVEGTYIDGRNAVTFKATALGDEVYDVTVNVNGLRLDVTMDVANGVGSMDGYAAQNGEDTQLLEEDRLLVEKLYAALNAELSAATLTAPAKFLRRAVGVWAQTPPSVPLQRLVMGESGRGYTMLCSYSRCGNGAQTGTCSGVYNWYSYAKHDCNKGGTGYERNQQIAQLGDHYSCSGDEYYLSSGSWVCGEPDHWYRPKVVGSCFGRCGGGCGGDSQYTLDATNHDGCVRNGHALASMYCNDQFTSASDDELFAPDCY